MNDAIVATAPAFCVKDGRITEQGGRSLLMNAHGSGNIRLVWKISALKVGPLRSGNVTFVSGSVTPASGMATALPALSCQSEKWSTSTPPMLTTILKTSRCVTLRLIEV